VNGQDVSSASHEEAVAAFLAASEPIVVEVLRREPREARPRTCNDASAQTDGWWTPPWADACRGCDITSNPRASNCGQPQQEDQDEDDGCVIEYEEVTLQRNGAEKLGLTLCYGDPDEQETEIYIGEIDSRSVAARDGRLQEGDQILQVNGADVVGRDQAIALFSEQRTQFTLLVARTHASVRDLLVEVPTKEQSISLSKMTSIVDVKVTVSPHHTLNFVRGVISEDDLHVSEEEIFEGLRSSGAVAVKRIVFKRDGQETPTKHLIVTFEKHVLPFNVKAGYLNCRVRPYVPNPQRCYRCQRFGHGGSNIGPGILSEDTPTPPNKIEFKKRKAKARWTRRQAKRATWMKYVSSITSFVSAKEAWDRYRKIKGGYHSFVVPLLNSPANSLNDVRDVASQRSYDPCRCQLSNGGPRRLPKTVSEPACVRSVGYASPTMYTNGAHLEHTMWLQQSLLREALCPAKDREAPLQWKVKRRSDGSRYITRGPARTRVLRERERKILEERAPLTTDDDNQSELKTGRYWPRGERKRHLERARDRKRKETSLR
ncbi:unnamed protein product, partial [Ixodes hexagonus]